MSIEAGVLHMYNLKVSFTKYYLQIKNALNGDTWLTIKINITLTPLNSAHCLVTNVVNFTFCIHTVVL